MFLVSLHLVIWNWQHSLWYCLSSFFSFFTITISFQWSEQHVQEQCTFYIHLTRICFHFEYFHFILLSIRFVVWNGSAALDKSRQHTEKKKWTKKSDCNIVKLVCPLDSYVRSCWLSVSHTCPRHISNKIK